MRWPFRRNKDTATVPQEIQEYYQSERRERTGVAWLLALGTLLATIAMAILLFFAGRWIYRTVVNRDDNTNQTAEQAVQDQPESTAPEENKTAPAPDSSNGTSSAPAAGSPPSPTPTPSTTTTNNGLPNTGPGDIVGVFAVTTIAGAIAHRFIYSRRLDS